MIRYSIVSFFVLLLTSLKPSTSIQAQDVRFRLKHPEIGMLNTLRTPSFVDIPGINREDNSVDFIANLEYFEQLQAQGFDVEMLETRAKRADDEYLNPNEIVTFLFEWADLFPEILHLEEIGKSLLGQPIMAARISTPENVERKPSLLFNSMHHAREVMSPEVSMDIIYFLLKNFNNPEMPWVTEWVENLSIWVVPQLNPDGNWIVWNDDSWWRKNARGAESEGRSAFGVDLNRNYPYEWGGCNGSSGNKSSQTYRGPSAASEPETRALMNLVSKANPLIDISYHSYSELVIAPYGCRGAYTPEKFVVDEIGKAVASRIEKDNGRGTYDYGTGWEIMYPVDGDDISWMYEKFNVLAYVVELNSSTQGFQPSYKKWRDITVKRNRPSWAYLLNRVMSGTQIRGQLFDAQTNEPIEGSIKIKGLDYSKESPRRSNGSMFYKLLSPGSYELIFESVGYLPQELAVSIGIEVLETDIYMEPSL